LKESTEGINIDKKYDTVISSLREELTVKEKTIEDLYGKLQAREDDFSDREKLQHKIDELSRTVNALKEELGTRKEQLGEAEKLVLNLKDDFMNAYDKGMRANKAIKHEFETNLHKAEIKVKDLEQKVHNLENERDSLQLELRKGDRALSSARKVAMVERNFLEVVKQIENKRKEKKMQLDRVLKDRAEQDAEEKKQLRTKIKILKEAFNKASEQVQSAQAREKELENKIKECDSLKVQLKRLSTVAFQAGSNSPKESGMSSDPIVLTGTRSNTPIIVGTANSFNRVKSMKVIPPAEQSSGISLPVPGPEAPSIIIQGSSPRNPSSDRSANNSSSGASGWTGAVKKTNPNT